MRPERGPLDCGTRGPAFRAQPGVFLDCGSHAPAFFAPARVLLLLTVMLLLLAGCATAATPAAPPTQAPAGPAPVVTVPAPAQTPTGLSEAPSVQPTGVYTRTGAAGYVDTFFVDPNLDDTTPPVGGRVLVRARLKKNGVRAGAMSIEVSWMQDGELQHCQFLPIYQSGCVIQVRDYPAGVFVPVTVTVRHEDAVFMGYGGFTPE